MLVFSLCLQNALKHFGVFLLFFGILWLQTPIFITNKSKAGAHLANICKRDHRVDDVDLRMDNPKCRESAHIKQTLVDKVLIGL